MCDPRLWFSAVNYLDSSATVVHSVSMAVGVGECIEPQVHNLGVHSSQFTKAPQQLVHREAHHLLSVDAFSVPMVQFSRCCSFFPFVFRAVSSPAEDKYPYACSNLGIFNGEWYLHKWYTRRPTISCQ